MFFFSSRRRHTRLQGDWSSDVCSSDLPPLAGRRGRAGELRTHHAGEHPRVRWVPEHGGDRIEPVPAAKIGRGSGRGRGEISGGAGSFKKKKKRYRWSTDHYTEER